MDGVPAQKRVGTVRGVYAATDGGFETRAVPALTLTYDGIPGDRHAGMLRPSGPREPWYPRGTEMRNERQLSILGADELLAVAERLGIERLEPEWIGGNLLLAGIPQLSALPPRTILMFSGGVSIRIDGDNGPCRKSGKAIAGHCPGREDIEFGFVKAAADRRGAVGWVERAGTIVPGETVTALIWRQRLYPAERPPT